MATGLERLGWHADEPAVRESVPAVLRGGNVVAVLPPAPAWAGPIVAALVGRCTPAGKVLVLAAPALVSEWAVALGAVTEGTGRTVDVARESGVAPADGRPCDVLVASPATALERHARSGLHPEHYAAIVFAWPEDWQADDAVAALLQDFPRDAQRVVLTARPDRIEAPGGVIERYARRAQVLGAQSTDPAQSGAPLAISVRTVPTSWASRPLSIARVLEVLPRPVTIWTADSRDHQLIRRTLGSLHEGVQLAARVVPEKGIIVCYDLPDAAELVRLAAVGEVVLLVPPGTELYVRALAVTRRPMQLHSAAAAAGDRDAALRQQIAARIDRDDDAAALYALAPLFEEVDPQLVAAALFGLWQGVAARTAPGATDLVPPGRSSPPAGVTGGPARSGPAPTTAKLWIGAGRKDDATVGDFVAVLIKEAGMDRARIGRIELHDTFALVEVPAEEAEAVAQRLVGLTIRKRKLSARVDRGRGAGSGRGAGRGA